MPNWPCAADRDNFKRAGLREFRNLATAMTNGTITEIKCHG